MRRAHETEELISAYPAALFKDLQLEEVLNKCVVDHGENLQILIDISEKTDGESLQGNTIHQLLWESLENPALWKRDHVEVLVRRQINPQFQQLSKRPPDPPREDAQSSINILPVVARDTSQIESEYDDICPTMTCTILSRIRKLLKNSGSLVNVNIKIVRPGALSALEQHFQKAEGIHGPGYIDIVHFDVHGGKKRGSTSKAGYLFFSSPDPDSNELIAEQASEVAHVLGKYGVSCAVLNACESARANVGDDANVAMTFEKEGIQNVLAMSFKICSDSVEIFLGVFYRSLFTEGCTFSAAAEKARSDLCNNSKDMPGSALSEICRTGLCQFFTRLEQTLLSAVHRNVILPRRRRASWKMRQTSQRHS